MVVTSAEVLLVDVNYVTVYNSNKSANIKVWLPSVISRAPVIGDYIVYDIDDVDYNNGSFIAFYGEAPISGVAQHVHQMMSNATVDGMQGIDASTKDSLKALSTGGVQ